MFNSTSSCPAAIKRWRNSASTEKAKPGSVNSRRKHILEVNTCLHGFGIRLSNAYTGSLLGIMHGRHGPFLRGWAESLGAVMTSAGSFLIWFSYDLLSFAYSTIFFLLPLFPFANRVTAHPHPGGFHLRRLQASAGPPVEILEWIDAYGLHNCSASCLLRTHCTTNIRSGQGGRPHPEGGKLFLPIPWKGIGLPAPLVKKTVRWLAFRNLILTNHSPFQNELLLYLRPCIGCSLSLREHCYIRKYEFPNVNIGRSRQKLWEQKS